MMSIARSPKQVGAILQNSRTQSGLTQAQLADLAGLRQATISTLEGGYAEVRLQTIFDVLAALDLEMAIRPRSKSSASDIDAIF